VRVETITNIVKEDTGKLLKKDVVVLWGGTKDVERNETSVGLKHIQAFVKNNKSYKCYIVFHTDMF
jgi:hypothetical protein